MTPQELTGQVRSHLLQRENPSFALHHQVLEPFLEMEAAAAKEGLRLGIFSSFRDFAAQLRIWNLKATGHRTLLDRKGHPLEFAKLEPEQILDCILTWSALPGASRHHWGTEMDVIDLGPVQEGYRVQLVPEEYATGGVFHPLNEWLQENLHRFGFYRPYQKDLGGVSPEPWHISYWPVSGPALQGLSLDLLQEVLKDSAIELKRQILEDLPRIYQQYILNVSPPPQA